MPAQESNLYAFFIASVYPRTRYRVYFKLIILVGINFYQYHIFYVLVKVIKDGLVVLKLVIQLD